MAGGPKDDKSRPLEIVPEPQASLAAGTHALPSPRPEDFAKDRLLSEILTARNDNDPRLDREFNALTPAMRRLFRERYAELASEKRNERGTIVYLLGRQLARTGGDADDFQFFDAVLTESPCLSMADCAHHSAGGADSHSEMGTEISLAYPQLVALVSIEHLIENGRASASSLIQARQALALAVKSPVQAVANKARAIQATLSRASGS